MPSNNTEQHNPSFSLGRSRYSDCLGTVTAWHMRSQWADRQRKPNCVGYQKGRATGSAALREHLSCAPLSWVPSFTPNNSEKRFNWAANFADKRTDGVTCPVCL